MFQDWTTIALNSLQDQIVPFVIKLIAAFAIFAIGVFVASLVGVAVTNILRKLKFNRLFEKGTWKEALEKAEIKIDASQFIGAIFKWVLVVVALLAAVDILGLSEFAGFLGSVLAYLPNVVVAALIFVVAVILADIVEKVVRATIEGAKFGMGHIAGAIVKWAIWIFAIFAILGQLKVAPDIVNALVYGFVALLVIAGGLAFGLGGKDIAAEVLEELKKKVKG